MSGWFAYKHSHEQVLFLNCQVGFSNPRGYFMIDSRTVLGGGIDWLFTWPVMLIVDAALVKTNKCGTNMLYTQYDINSPGL